VDQYYSKNIPDAESWLDVTEDALKNLTEIITSMIKQSTKGSNGDLKAEDRQIILEQLKALGDEVYSTGDADYAGRYVFTGYRTDTSLSFDKEYNTEYNITEQLGNSSITKLTKVNTGKLLDITAANYKDAGFDKISEQDVKATEVYRIQLSYNDCKKNGTPSISFQEKQADGSYQEVTWPDQNTHQPAIEEISSTADPYSKVAGNPDAIVYVPETGELLLGENRYKTLMDCKDDPATSGKNEGEIQVTYQKNHWVKGDLRPEHYFKCDATVDGKTIKYNEKYTQDDEDRQGISEKYLEQIIAVLNKAGYVKSVRGAQGGYRIAKDPADYTVGMILRLTEGSLAPVACLEDGADICERCDTCETLEVWQELYNAVNKVVDGVTIADLVERRKKRLENLDYSI
jgi:flagellar hook-associated protein 3 FlgL